MFHVVHYICFPLSIMIVNNQFVTVKRSSAYFIVHKNFEHLYNQLN